MLITSRKSSNDNIVPFLTSDFIHFIHVSLSFLLYPFFLIFLVVQNTYCQVSQTLSLEDDPGRTFNWTSKAEQCNPGELCQETVLLIKAGKIEENGGSQLPAPQCRLTAETHHSLLSYLL